IGQVDISCSVTRSEPIQILANFARGLRGAGSAMISPHAFVLGKSHQECLTGLQFWRIAAPILDDVGQARIVGAFAQGLRRSGQRGGVHAVARQRPAPTTAPPRASERRGHDQPDRRARRTAPPRPPPRPPPAPPPPPAKTKTSGRRKRPTCKQTTTPQTSSLLL